MIDYLHLLEGMVLQKYSVWKYERSVLLSISHQLEELQGLRV